MTRSRVLRVLVLAPLLVAVAAIVFAFTATNTVRPSHAGVATTSVGHVEAEVDIQPETINTDDKEPALVRVFITLEDGYSAPKIDPGSVRLCYLAKCVDNNGHSHLVPGEDTLQVDFDRAVVATLFPAGTPTCSGGDKKAQVTLKVTGSLTGPPLAVFQGTHALCLSKD